MFLLHVKAKFKCLLLRKDMPDEEVEEYVINRPIICNMFSALEYTRKPKVQ